MLMDAGRSEENVREADGSRCPGREYSCLAQKKHATKRIYKQRFAAFLYRSDKIRTCDLRLPKAAL